MKKFYKRISLLLLSFALLLLTGCGSGSGGNTNATQQKATAPAEGQAQKPANAPPFVTIGTAASGSSLYLYGTGLADLLKDNLTYSQFDVEETGGSIANVNLVESGELEMGLTTVGVLTSALKGTGKFEGKPVQNTRIGWKIAPTVTHFVALKKSGMKNIEDVKGKRVSIGSSGSAANQLALKILADHGIKESDVTLSYMGWNEGIEALGDGAVDVALVLGTLPAPVIESLGVTQPVTILNLNPEKVSLDKTRTVYKIPAKTYSGQDEEAVTSAEDMYVLFNAELDEQTVYDITKLAMTNTERLGKVHPMGAEATAPTKEEIELLQAELHPGVLKYLKEIGKY
jgi:TRAP transporter TAXI family solute receptor